MGVVAELGDLGFVGYDDWFGGWPRFVEFSGSLVWDGLAIWDRICFGWFSYKVSDDGRQCFGKLV